MEEIATGAWWCPKCKEEVGGYHVTNQERHEACGTSVEWVEELPSVLSEIADLKEQVERLTKEVSYEKENSEKWNRDWQLQIGKAMDLADQLAASEADRKKLRAALEGCERHLHSDCVWDTATMAAVEAALSSQKGEKCCNAPVRVSSSE